MTTRKTGQKRPGSRHSARRVVGGPSRSSSIIIIDARRQCRILWQTLLPRENEFFFFCAPPNPTRNGRSSSSTQDSSIQPNEPEPRGTGDRLNFKTIKRPSFTTFNSICIRILFDALCNIIYRNGIDIR